LNFFGKYLPTTDAAWLRDGEYSAEFFDYDWQLNERKTPPGDKLQNKTRADSGDKQ
jgi:hypothetical protein